jgi:Flp pilus assembly protein TadD
MFPDPLWYMLDGYPLGILLNALALPLPGLPVPSDVTAQIHQAYEQASRTLSSDPTNVKARFERGVACRILRRFPQARADLEEVVRSEPAHAGAWVLLAEVLDNLGERDRAEGARKRALELANATDNAP